MTSDERTLIKRLVSALRHTEQLLKTERGRSRFRGMKIERLERKLAAAAPVSRADKKPKRCVYCGEETWLQTACWAHQDLLELDQVLSRNN